MSTRRDRCREAAAAGCTRFPVTREIILDADTPVSAFAKLHRGAFGFLFESLEGGERWARFSFVGTEPRRVFRYGPGTVEEHHDGAWHDVGDAAPLDHLAAQLRPERTLPLDGLPAFTGGMVGFWGYDVVRTVEDLPDAPPDDRGVPMAMAFEVDTLLVLDHLFHRATVIASVPLTPGADDAGIDAALTDADARAAEWIARLSSGAPLAPLDAGPAPAPLTPSSTYAAERFVADVDRIREYIAAGDAFQVVLSRRLDVTPAPDPLRTYRWLRAINPAPYCYFLRCDEWTIAGASPEVLVRVQQGEVTVRPIAGTRRRGTTADGDAANERELLADPKERAEHLMLVDLGRNDVGRVATYGSVVVREQMVVERYSHVMHLVSEVRGRLCEGRDAIDALAAAFPAGTVSGAPKVRAMELIDELEPVRRGPYAGAVGYAGWGADVLDTAIAIRTVVFGPGVAYVQAGAGIVADSVPAAELAETEAKAAVVLAALGRAAQRPKV